MKRILVSLLVLSVMASASDWNCITFFYDGDRITTIDHDGTVEKLFYNENGQQSMSVFLGDTIFYDYTNGNLARTRSNTNTTTFLYDDSSRIILEYNTEGDSSKYEYKDGTTRIYNSDGSSSVWFYEKGKVWRIEDNSGMKKFFFYDDDGDLLSSSSTDGTREKHKYVKKDGKIVKDCFTIWNDHDN